MPPCSVGGCRRRHAARALVAAGLRIRGFRWLGTTTNASP